MKSLRKDNAFKVDGLHVRKLIKVAQSCSVIFLVINRICLNVRLEFTRIRSSEQIVLPIFSEGREFISYALSKDILLMETMMNSSMKNLLTRRGDFYLNGQW
ncbi:MAG: hypothetical protein Ta2E_10050 [Mycoplasmoidaceae bacterium]|nr:MAG: hypothetical protein Ta2E_10050 [Mycoplasmoidaceae bacterium]